MMQWLRSIGSGKTTQETDAEAARKKAEKTKMAISAQIGNLNKSILSLRQRIADKDSEVRACLHPPAGYAANQPAAAAALNDKRELEKELAGVRARRQRLVEQMQMLTNAEGYRAQIDSTVATAELTTQLVGDTARDEARQAMNNLHNAQDGLHELGEVLAEEDPFTAGGDPLDDPYVQEELARLRVEGMPSVAGASVQRRPLYVPGVSGQARGSAEKVKNGVSLP